MTLTLSELHWRALDPRAQARFWAEVLGLEVLGSEVLGSEVPGSEVPGSEVLGDLVPVPGFALRFVATDRPKTVRGRIHLDLTSSSPEVQRDQVATVLRLGGRHLDVGQHPAEAHVVLADPEGNELCVIPAGNRFLADTGRIGAVNCDGSHALGVFWSQVLDWPLVWDKGEETAIQSPRGGSKFTWSGPPLMPRDNPQRISFHLTARRPDDLTRLTDLGATHLDAGRFLDPDGNEFSVSEA